MSRSARRLWAVLITDLSVADLGWSADNPAPQEALDAIDEARDTSLRFLAGPPFAERYGPFTWWPESSRVAALLIADRGAVRTQVDPRTRFCAELGPARAPALLTLAFLKGLGRGREQASADDELLGGLAVAMREAAGVKAMEDAGLVAWEQRGGESR